MLHNCIKPGKPSIITNFVNCGNRLGVFLRAISFYNAHQLSNRPHKTDQNLDLWRTFAPYVPRQPPCG